MLNVEVLEPLGPEHDPNEDVIVEFGSQSTVELSDKVV